jgi:hypothetical protein
VDKRYNPIFQRAHTDTDSASTVPASPGLRSRGAGTLGQPDSLASPGHLAAFDDGVRAALAVDGRNRTDPTAASPSAGRPVVGRPSIERPLTGEPTDRPRSAAIPPIGQRPGLSAGSTNNDQTTHPRWETAHDAAAHHTVDRRNAGHSDAASWSEAGAETTGSGVARAATAGFDSDPFQTERPTRLNPWIGVLWFIGLMSIAVSSAGYWYQTTVSQWGFPNENGGQPFDYVVSQLVYAFGGPLLTVGLFTVAALLFRLAIRRDHRNGRAARTAQPESESTTTLRTRGQV